MDGRSSFRMAISSSISPIVSKMQTLLSSTISVDSRMPVATSIDETVVLINSEMENNEGDSLHYKSDFDQGEVDNFGSNRYGTAPSSRHAEKTYVNEELLDEDNSHPGVIKNHLRYTNISKALTSSHALDQPFPFDLSRMKTLPHANSSIEFAIPTLNCTEGSTGNTELHKPSRALRLIPAVSNSFSTFPSRRQCRTPSLERHLVHLQKSRTLVPLSAIPAGMLDLFTACEQPNTVFLSKRKVSAIEQLAPDETQNTFTHFPSSAISVSGLSAASGRTMITGSIITFRDIHYVIPTKKMIWSKPIQKTVLCGVSGVMHPGLNAIMGPTGCGKSSLLDVLAGRKDPKFLTGEVLIDGEPQPKNFKCVSGYVVQDDILMGTLTVRECLYFATVLRRKGKFKRKETDNKVTEVLEELGLLHVADTKIGTEFIRGISGGERKRTSIGTEIISDPPVLFLDEPTTGLDAFTAGSVIQTLKTLSRRGRTIIFSIHQPKYSIYKLFDSLTLVSQGQLVYHGAAKKKPINYFAKLGYICENHNNPPDFFLDILHGEARLDNTESDEEREYDLTTTEASEQINVLSESLVRAWKESAENKRTCRYLENASRSPEHKPHEVSPSPTIGYSASFCRQMQIVCWRTFINLARDPQASIVQILVYLFFAISMGVVYFDLDTSLESGMQNRAGLFFFATLQVVFVNIGSIELFLKERTLFIHEHSSGYYRVSSYFLAKLVCDVLPTKALPVFFFMPITYWMVKLVPTASNFFFFEIILTLGTVSAASAAMLVSASVTVFSIANVIISILFVFMMVFGGFLINLKTLSLWISWLRYFSIFRYTLGGLLVNEMATLNFCPAVNRSNEEFVDTRTCESGTLYLNDLDLPNATTWGLWSNVLGLGCITVVCFTLCYVQLRRIRTFK